MARIFAEIHLMPGAAAVRRDADHFKLHRPCVADFADLHAVKERCRDCFKKIHSGNKDKW